MSSIWLTLLVSCLVFAQTAPEMEADLKAHPEHLSTRIQLANTYLRQKQPDKVVALLNPYTDQMTNQGFLALANAYSAKKDYLNEVRALNLLVLKEPNNYQWHMLLGESYLKQMSAAVDYEKKLGLATSAIQEFRKTLGFQPKYKPAFDVLLTTLLNQHANNEARELLLEGVNSFGHRPELFRELCRLNAGDGFLDTAVDNCREAIQIAPEYPDNYVFLVQALYDQKEEELAEKDIISAARKFPRSEFVQWAAGTLFFKKKNYPVAARYFQAATVADPKSGRAHYGLARSMFESGQEAGSLPHFVIACNSDISTVDDFLVAGGKLKQRGNMELGEKFIQSAYNCKTTVVKEERKKVKTKGLFGN